MVILGNVNGASALETLKDIEWLQVKVALVLYFRTFHGLFPWILINFGDRIIISAAY